MKLLKPIAYRFFLDIYLQFFFTLVVAFLKLFNNKHQSFLCFFTIGNDNTEVFYMK
jgi:hypothetical protein